MKNLCLLFLALQLVTACSLTKTNPGTSSHVVDSTSAPEVIHPDTLSFIVTAANNIIFDAVLATDTLALYLDTGGTAIVLKHSAIKEKTTLLNGKNESYAAENYVPLEGTYALSLGELNWDSLTVYPTSLLPEEADGHFGWNLFEGKIVELDYDKNLMIVHSSELSGLDNYTKMDIEYINTLFCIQAVMQVGDRQMTNRYLFDSGFQRAIVLDKDLTAAAKFPQDLPVIKESRLRNSAGTEFINKVVEIDAICFKDLCADNVPVQLLSTPNPARFETHILGNEILKRFNTVLDFKNHYVYLKPNSLMSLPYKDAS